MELKPGYKMTEVGVIPEDWELSKLRSLLEFSNGFNADQNSYGHGLPFISTLESVFGNFSFYSYKKACGQKKTVRGSKNSRRLSNGTPAI